MEHAVKVSAKAAQLEHHPYASMNWIRFIGSLRCADLPDRLSESQPLDGTPRVNAQRLRPDPSFVNRRKEGKSHTRFIELTINKHSFFQRRSGV